MYKLVRPEKDTTIYSYAKQKNAGIDEILELNTRKGIKGEHIGSEYSPSRILISFPELDEDFSGLASDGPNAFASFGFDTANRSSSSSTTFGAGPPNAFAFFGESKAPERQDQKEKEQSNDIRNYDPSARLRMYFANGQGMPYDYELESYLLSKNWTEGRGRLRENIEEAANWELASESNQWNNPGGDFEDLPVAKETFQGDDPDVDLKVDSLLSDNSENGFLIKREDESFDELSELKFFSLQTRTIYVPHILVGIDDFEHDVEDANPVEKENITAYIANLQNRYEQGRYRFFVSVEEKYEQREFLGIRPTDRVSSIEDSRYLPKRSLRYEIRDERTGLKLFPFNERYTSVSYENGTHYFDLDLNYLMPKRKYEIKLKYVDPETQNETLFNNDQTFIVEK